MKLNQGIVAPSLVFGLVIMAIALPVAGQLALKNQDNRNRAAGCPMCYDDYYCNASTGYKCVPPDWVKPTSSPGPQATRTPTSHNKPTGSYNCVRENGVVGAGMGCCSGLERTDCTGSGSFVSCICKTPATNHECSKTSDCPSGQTCGSSGKCMQSRKPGGSSCSEDSECISDLCMSGRCTWKCANGICPEIRKPGGSSCSEDSECISDLCMSGRCTWKCANGICPTFKPTQPPARNCKCISGFYRGSECGTKLNNPCGQ